MSGMLVVVDGEREKERKREKKRTTGFTVVVRRRRLNVLPKMRRVNISRNKLKYKEDKIR